MIGQAPPRGPTPAKQRSIGCPAPLYEDKPTAQRVRCDGRARMIGQAPPRGPTPAKRRSIGCPAPLYEDKPTAQ
jgi:hypothetical protein